MKRIKTTVAVLFVKHGSTPAEKDQVIVGMLDKGQAGKTEMADSTFKRVMPNVTTDVPDWCADTQMWAWMEKDGSLEELIIKAHVQVPKDKPVTTAEKAAADVGNYLEGAPTTGPKGRKA